ncbi:MAG: cyclase family protein [Armatimonadaceae bacterium]
MEIRDISTPLRAGFPVWPGHEPLEMTLTHSHEAGNGVQLTHFSIGAHTGTHLDAPRHFIAGGSLVTELDMNALIGSVQVVHFCGEGPVPRSFFEAQNLPDPLPRLLLRCDVHAGKLHDHESFFEDYAGITPEAAEWLVARGLRLIGTDYLSIGPYRDTPTGGNREVHITLLGNRVVIVEGLDLRGVEPGEYTLICLPIAVPCDGAPCRAVLLPAGALTG